MSTPTKLGLSDRDGELLFYAIKFLDPKPKFDWKNVASVMGFKNASVASTRFRQVLKKFEPLSGDIVNGSPVTATPKTKKRKTDDSEASSGGSSKASARKRGRKATDKASAAQESAVKQEVDDEEAETEILGNGNGDVGGESEGDESEKGEGQDNILGDMQAEYEAAMED